MKQPLDATVTFTMHSWEAEFPAGGEVVLTASSSLPHFSGGSERVRNRLNRFYRHMERCFRRQAARLAQSAAGARSEARQCACWFSPWHCTLSADVCQDGDALRVAWQTQRADGAVISGGECWRLPEGILEQG